MRLAKSVVFLVLGCLPGVAGSTQPDAYQSFVATAYNQYGETASGVVTERHIVAADPDLIPIGSRIKIKGAGRYSGEYVVADTGEKIQGRRLDIYMPNKRACVRFGKKRVKVRVIAVGNGTKQATESAAHEVKKDVQNDLAKNAVGGAATQDDWALKKKVGSPATVASQGAVTPRDSTANSPQ